MFAIIAAHCVCFTDVPDSYLMRAVITPFKFGTIGFFLISGFLLGERVDRASALDYFRQRLQKVFLPWLFWYCICVVALLLLHPSWNRTATLQGRGPALVLAHWGKHALVSTALWFVPNLLCGIGILLLFKRHLHRPVFGVVLALFNLFYAINIYTNWVVSLHTTALLGFVLFLWLGAFAARHETRFRSFMARVSIVPLFGLVFLAGALSFGEYRFLTLRSVDPLNTLRATNQVFSVLVVLLFFKIRRTTYPRWIDVRKHTFGLYFAHSLLLILVVGIFEHYPRVVPAAHFSAANVSQLSLWLISFLFIYAASLGASIWLADHRHLQWTVGIHTGKPGRLAPTSWPGASRRLRADGTAAEAGSVRK